MDIDRALDRMDKTTLQIVKADLLLYKRDHDTKRLEEAIALIMQYSDASADDIEKTIIGTLLRRL